MKILYITFLNMKKGQETGTCRKVNWQTEAMRELGHEVVLGWYDGDNYLLNGKNSTESYNVGESHKDYIYCKILIRFKTYRFIVDHIHRQNYDFIYFRFVKFDPWLTRMFKKISSITPCIYLEIPTFPFYGEIFTEWKKHIKNKNFIKLIFSITSLSISVFNQRKLKKYFKGIVTFTYHKRIWGIPVIVIENGINVKDIPIRKRCVKESTSMNLIGVANVSEWHGFDRIVKGQYLYNKLKQSNLNNVHFTIIGDGSSIPKLKKLVHELEMDRYVTFSGVLRGESLDQVMDFGDIAIGSLGMHRINLNKGSTLKIREYCSRGIPFIYSYDEAKLHENISFALKLPANDNPIDINTILELWYRTKYIPNISEEMRKFAIANYDWVSQMKKIMDSIPHTKAK